MSKSQEIPNFIWFMKDGVAQNKRPTQVESVKQLPQNKGGKL